MFRKRDDWYERSYDDDSLRINEDCSGSDNDSGSNVGAFFVLFVLIVGVLAILGLMGFSIYRDFNVKVLDVQKSVVPVQIYDEYQRDEYVTFISVGKTLVPVDHDAVYNITFDYDGMKFVVDNEKVYAEYYDDVGRFVDVVLEVSALSDGTVRYQIVELEPEKVS